MLHQHHHHTCTHSVALKYCSACDVVYCIDCGKEWKYTPQDYAIGSIAHKHS